MPNLPLTTLVTVLALALYIGTSFKVGRARVRPDHGRVQDPPLQVGVWYRLEHPLPGALAGPPIKPSPGEVPVPEPCGQVPPRGTGSRDSQYGIDEPAVYVHVGQSLPCGHLDDRRAMFEGKWAGLHNQRLGAFTIDFRESLR